MISGILDGGIRGFRMCCVASLTCVFLLGLVVRWNRDGLSGLYRYSTSSLFGAPQLADGHIYVCVNCQFTVSMHGIKCVERPGEKIGVLVAQLVWRRSCVADRLPVVVRFPAGPRVSLKW